MKPKTILVVCLLLFGVFDLVYGLVLRDGVSIVAGAAIVVIGGVILKRTQPPG
jgi:hypothetical protein